MCIFAGYPRSGHSLVGSIIDAHPNMMLGDEVGAQILAAKGHDQQYIFNQLIMRSRQGPRQVIHTGWQGESRELEVIGDKPRPPLAWFADKYAVNQDPNMLSPLLETIKVPIKFIHVTRNSYGNITELFRHKWAKSLHAAAELYFDTFDRYWDWEENMGTPWLNMKLEELIADPEKSIARLCRFLEQDTDEKYVSACAHVIWKEPRIRRFEVEWPKDLIAFVTDMIDERELLKGYTYAL